MIQLIKKILYIYRAPITVVTSLFGFILEFIIEFPFLLALYLSGDIQSLRRAEVLRVQGSRRSINLSKNHQSY